MGMSRDETRSLVRIVRNLVGTLVGQEDPFDADGRPVNGLSPGCRGEGLSQILSRSDVVLLDTGKTVWPAHGELTGKGRLGLHEVDGAHQGEQARRAAPARCPDEPLDLSQTCHEGVIDRRCLGPCVVGVLTHLVVLIIQQCGTPAPPARIFWMAAMASLRLETLTRRIEV